MRSLDVACGAAFLTSFLLAGCASNGETPGAAWLAWATLRSLAGSPPKPPDLYEEPVRVTDALEFAEITAGGEHTCALTVDGETYCWGSNRDDQLGNASITETCGEGAGAYPCSSSPVRVPDMPRFKSIVAMRSGTCGLDESGAVHCWGGGFGGRDEAGFRTSSAAPIRVPGEHVFASLASSSSSDGAAYGLTAEGRVWCWRLSDAPGSALTEPELVPTGVTFTAIGFGGVHGCGIDDARHAYCWGNDMYGSLGIGSSGHDGGVRESATPVPVQGALEVVEIGAAGGHTCALTAQGDVHCWGLAFPVHSSLSPLRLSGHSLPHGAVPVLVDFGGVKLSTLATADLQTCGLTAEGAAHCVSATPQQRGEAIRIESDQPFVKIAVGSRHACAIGADGFAYCWGEGESGQVGRVPSGRRW